MNNDMLPLHITKKNSYLFIVDYGLLSCHSSPSKLKKIIFALANAVATASEESFRCNDEMVNNLLASLNSYKASMTSGIIYSRMEYN